MGKMKFEMMSAEVDEELDRKQLAIDMLQYKLNKVITENQAILAMAYDIDSLHNMTCVCDGCLEIYEKSDEYLKSEAERLQDIENQRAEGKFGH